MLNPRKLSQDPVFNNLLQRDRLVVLRSALDEADPAKRNGTAGLDTVAAALASRLSGDYLDIALADAQALPDADPPAVKPLRLYGITSDEWNASGIQTTVYVQGVRPDAYHTLGIVYDAQAKGQLVEVDVAAGTYAPLAQNKADIDPATGRVAEGQQPLEGPGIKYLPGIGYTLTDGLDFALDYAPDVDYVNRRFNPNTGKFDVAAGWITYSTYVKPGTRYRSQLPLFYAGYTITNYSLGASTGFLGAWNATGATVESDSPVSGGALFLLWLSIQPSELSRTRVVEIGQSGGRFRGAWVKTTLYKKYDQVVQAGSLYYSNADQQSGNTFNANLWTLITVSGNGGTLKTVNGVAPDANGDVQAGTVRTVEGVAPDANGNVVLPSFDPFDVPQAIRDTVAAGYFVTGELQGTQPEGSLPTMEFTGDTYWFRFQRIKNGSTAWVRFRKAVS